MKDNKFIRDTKLKLPIEFSSEDLNENYIGEVIFKDEDDLTIYEGNISLLHEMNRFGSPSASDVTFGGRYGTSISINDSLHWELLLLSRLSKNIQGKSYSIPELIAAFTSDVVDKKVSNYASYFFQLPKKDFSELVMELIRIVIVESRHIDEQAESIEEFKISDLTFNPVPALRYLFLSIFEPTLLLPDEWRIIKESFPELHEDEGLSNLLNSLDDKNGEIFFMESVVTHSDAIKNSIANSKINWGNAKKHAQDQIKKAQKALKGKKDLKRKPENFSVLNSFSLYVAYLDMSYDENICMGSPEDMLFQTWPTLSKISQSCGKITMKPKKEGLINSFKEGFKFGYKEAETLDKLKDKNIKPKK